LKKQFEDVIKRAVAVEDHTEVSHGFENEPPAAGKTVARLVEYIEFGLQEQKFNGQAKDPARNLHITFELLGPKNIREIELADGTKKKLADRVTIRLTKGSRVNEKSTFFKVFNLLRYGRKDITHMSQMLGEAFVVEVHHSKPAESGPTKGRVYANLRQNKEDGGNFTIFPPYQEDALTGEKKPYKVAQPIGDMRLFVWDDPTKDTWDCLFIDGTRTVRAGDLEQQVSKNWIQEAMLRSLDFEGSPLEAFLVANGYDAGTPPAQVDDLAQELDDEIPFEAAAPKKKAVKTVQKQEEFADPLADLGL